MTGLGLSIGTGLAVETLLPDVEVYDDQRVFDRVDIDKYDTIYINTFTLIRNIVGALDTPIKKKFLHGGRPEKELIDVLLSEMTNLNMIFDSKIKVVFFAIDYERNKKITLRANIPKTMGTLNTDIYLLHKIMMKQLSKQDINFAVYKEYLPSSQYRTLVLTHVSIDLLSVKKVKKLELLESHTGKVVIHKNFSKKYLPVGKSDMLFLPFCEDLLGIFGDKAIVSPAPINIRREVYNEAVKNKWNYTKNCDVVGRMQYIKLYFRNKK
jgi:hypothetical protein